MKKSPLYECHDCHKVLDSTEFYWFKTKPKDSSKKSVKKKCPRCKPCERQRRNSKVEYQVQQLYNRAKIRCKQKGIRFNLTKAWYREKLNGTCELSGLPFEKTTNNRKPKARAASVDRIDPEKGYTPENCRMICSALNNLLSSWGESNALGVILPYLRRLGFEISSLEEEKDEQ